MNKSQEFIANLLKLDKAALLKALVEAKKELSKYNLEKSVSKENNNRKYKLLKNKIARINTILTKVKYGQ
jgi:ribosomal protein L29